MDYTCHECGEPQSVWMVARCSNPNKSVSCSEAFCFKCLGQTYPQLYNNIFKGLWWICPSCTGLCKCETCSDPVKKAEYNRLAKRKLNQRASKPAPVEEIKTLKLRSGTVHNKVSRMIPEAPVVPEEPENWICSRCSSSNSLDDIECIACGCHRKRNTRKRISQEPVHEDKFHAMKETRKATENNEDKAAPVK